MQRVKLSTEQALYLRMRGQGLLPEYSRVTGPDVGTEVARFSGGLQSQDLFAAALGLRVRAAGSTLADFQRSRLQQRSVAWTWLMRGTLHVVPAGDLDWLLAVLGPPLIAAGARRRAELGLSAEIYAAGLDVVLDKLASSGAATREELGQALAGAGLPRGYSIERHLLYRAALEGRVCLGPDRGNAPGHRPTFVLLPDWLGRSLRDLSAEERAAARVELARRYLGAFAPATLSDFSAWTGVNVRDLREAWDAIKSEVVEVEVAGRSACLPAARTVELEDPIPQTVVRLLPAFDTYILGHATRELIDDGRYAAKIGGGGMLPAMVLVDGQLRGTWKTNRKGHRVSISLEPFELLPPGTEAAIAGEAADIERFLGDTG